MFFSHCAKPSKGPTVTENKAEFMTGRPWTKAPMHLEGTDALKQCMWQITVEGAGAEAGKVRETR
jgi:hypothetical protein